MINVLRDILKLYKLKTTSMKTILVNFTKSNANK